VGAAQPFLPPPCALVLPSDTASLQGRKKGKEGGEGRQGKRCKTHDRVDHDLQFMGAPEGGKKKGKRRLQAYNLHTLLYLPFFFS